MKAATETSYPRIERVMWAITDDPVRPHRLDEVAGIANLSPFHFHRIYRAMVGESVVETAHRACLARAALDLASGSAAITGCGL